MFSIQGTDATLAEKGRSECNRANGRIGGIQTSLRHGREHMQQIARRGGRPTRQMGAEKAWRLYNTRPKHAGRHGHLRRR